MYLCSGSGRPAAGIESSLPKELRALGIENTVRAPKGRGEDPAKAFFKISLVPNLDAGEMISKRLDQTLRQSSHAVLLALAVADREFGAFEVNIFHA
jgi:hypothetical protein